MTQPIYFYFDFASPYGYLASLRIDAIASGYDREVAWCPIMLGAIFKLTGTVPNLEAPLRGPYLRRDVPRAAKLMDAPLTFPESAPINALVPSRAFWWMHDIDPDMAKGLAQAIFHAHWGEGRDVSTVEAVTDIAAGLGIDPAELAAALADPAVKQRLKHETDGAAQAGVFGSPFVIVDGEPFWGADRLDQVERWLATGGW